MKRLCSILVLSLLMTLGAWAQGTSDFADHFVRQNRDADLTCVTVGPKMMAKMLKLPAESETADDKRIKSLLSQCNSMRIVTAHDRASFFRRRAIDLFGHNASRYSQYRLNDLGSQVDDCLWVRKRGGNIVELIVLSPADAQQFSMIDITGSIDDDFIRRLVGN